MGYYVQGPANGKEQHIVNTLNGRIVDKETAKAQVESGGVIVVMHNGPFDAAGFAYDMKEFRSMTLPHDSRPKTFVIIDRKVAIRETGFQE